MIKVNAMSFALLIKALRIGNVSLTDLVEKTGLHYLTVAHYIRTIRNAGEVHVSSRRIDALGRNAVKLYTLGPGIDAKSTALSARERQRRRRARVAREKQAANTKKQTRTSKKKLEMLAMIQSTAGRVEERELA